MQFQSAETALWGQKGIQRSPKELVQAHGDILTAKIAHRFRDPGSCTLDARNGNCGDFTNPCATLVMANAYSENGILFDHCSRRDMEDPFKFYSEDILSCHEEYLFRIRDNMSASVEIVMVL